MYKLLDTLSRLHHENYVRAISAIIKKKLAVGLVYAWDDIEACRNMNRNLEASGIKIKAIFVPGMIKWPLEIDGKLIVPWTEIKKRDIKLDVVLMVANYWIGGIQPILSNCGYRTLFLLDTDLEARNYDFLMKNLLQLNDAYSLLFDDESRNVFCAYIMGRYGGTLDKYRFANEAQYMLNGFLPKEGDVAIDGGAYDGQSARDLCLLGAQVYSFELDKKNYKNCLPLSEKFGFTVENAGLGKSKGKTHYRSSGSGSAIMIDGNEMAEIVDIDTYLTEKEINQLNYLKLDVEGAEMDALTGAVRCIGRDKPKMAVSAYHKQEDLWQLICYIHSIRPDYEFSLRHYKVDARNYWLGDAEKEILEKCGADLCIPTPWELVLYCH